MHSATKYLNGHSDMVGGVLVVGENADLRERLTYLQNAVGAIAGPFDSFLALRGLKTLALAHGAPLQQCHGRGPLPGKAPPGREGHLSRAAEPSPA